jgi:hypothetical protein
MKIALVTDAWQPQVNGVVTTLVGLVTHLLALGHEVLVIHPGLFTTRPCPGNTGIDLEVKPYAGVSQRLQEFNPQAIHLYKFPGRWLGRTPYAIDGSAQQRFLYRTWFRHGIVIINWVSER